MHLGRGCSTPFRCPKQMVPNRRVPLFSGLIQGIAPKRPVLSCDNLCTYIYIHIYSYIYIPGRSWTDFWTLFSPGGPRPQTPQSSHTGCCSDLNTILGIKNMIQNREVWKGAKVPCPGRARASFETLTLEGLRPQTPLLGHGRAKLHCWA